MERNRYMLVRVLDANYQNGNTLKAMTRNATRGYQLAMSNDLDALKEYADGMKALAPLYIEDRDNGQTVYRIER